MSCQKDKTIWNGKNGVFMIAEIGGNHEGNFEYAKRLTNMAIESGVDAVKFQIYSAKSLVNPKENLDRFNHFKKFELPRGQHIELARICARNNVRYIASVWDVSTLDWIDKYIGVYKIGSGDMTAYPIIEEIIKKNKPTILATGMSTLREVRDSVDFIASVNPRLMSEEKLALLQCTSAYPTPDSDANLRALVSLKRSLKLTTGYSDHTIGSLALEMAVALGAEILEFHFTDSRKGKVFRDHKISLTPKEVVLLRKRILRISNLLGDGKKNVMPSEEYHRGTFRRALYPSADLRKGKKISGKDLVCLRPNHGIDARDYKVVVGKKIIKKVCKNQKLSKNDFI